MRGLASALGRVGFLCWIAVAAGGCALVCPGRVLRSRMTLAPGQTAEGRFVIPDGSRGLVQLYRLKGVLPHPDVTTFVGDGAVLVESPEATSSPLGYVQKWLEDGREWRVVLRNTTAEPVGFHWAVQSSSDAIAEWDLSTAR